MIIARPTILTLLGLSGNTSLYCLWDDLWTRDSGGGRPLSWHSHASWGLSCTAPWLCTEGELFFKASFLFYFTEEANKAVNWASYLVASADCVYVTVTMVMTSLLMCSRLWQMHQQKNLLKSPGPAGCAACTQLVKRQSNYCTSWLCCAHPSGNKCDVKTSKNQAG